MSCIALTVTPVAPAVLGVTPLDGAGLAVEAAAGASLGVTPAEGAALTVAPASGATLAIVPTPGAMLTVGEVCGVSGGTLVVLAGSDGPLRTRDGGYFLLNPATNPPEE